MRRWLWLGLLLALLSPAWADDGYRLWLRYDPLPAGDPRTAWRAALTTVDLATPAGTETPTLAAARDELRTGLRGLLGTEPEIRVVRAAVTPPAASDETYALSRPTPRSAAITATTDRGVLYGAFALLRHLQTGGTPETLAQTSGPRIRHRLLNHWDNLNGTVERGYAGSSLWDWARLPGELSPRYRDYARACASVGINGTVLTNVNANAQVLTPDYLAKVAALAAVFRPYGLRVYLTARFSAPIELARLPTADPRDPAVVRWWHDTAAAVYRQIPDFGGFLVKANSEGQPGPQAYGRNHADGANLLADAVAPYGGLVIWRAFVYDDGVPDDRHKQAVNEFRPLDGSFRPNVVVQVKNGAIDFMPREPFHPLFGAMPATPLGLEVQITQEYLGGSGEVAFLAPMWREVLTADTGRPGPGATVARVIDGSVDGRSLSLMAGVANTGTARNWCGNQLAPANWYAFGRLAWNPDLPAERIADEWTRQTFGADPAVVATLTDLLLSSREAVVDYSMPLGLHHLMARDHHQGPGPWVTGGRRADWTSTYYHRADSRGIGFDRTATGSNALGQYAPAVAARWSDPTQCPEELLLWFHHLPWDHRLASGRTLWDELCRRYQRGVDEVRRWQQAWEPLAGKIDAERHAKVRGLLRNQEAKARIWRDACIQYFATFSGRPVPPGVEPPEHPLAYYQELTRRFTPGSPDTW